MKTHINTYNSKSLHICHVEKASKWKLEMKILDFSMKNHYLLSVHYLLNLFLTLLEAKYFFFYWLFQIVPALWTVMLTSKQIWTILSTISSNRYQPYKNWILHIISLIWNVCLFVCMFVCLFVCLVISDISHKLLVRFCWNLVSREVLIIGRQSSKLGVIRIEIRIWDPDNCFSWTTGRILMKLGELGLY